MFTTTITALAATLLFARTHAVPEGFVISDVSPGKDFKVPVQMMFLDRERALVLEKSGKIVISQPNRPGFPKETYLALEDVYNNDETGALSMALDPEWETGSKYVYVFYGSKAANGLDAGMRVSRFTHKEIDGGVSSRGQWDSQQVIWHDTDGWGNTPQWHYGGSLNFGPDGKMYLTLGDKYTTKYLLSKDHHAGCVIRVNKDGSIPEGNLPSSVKPASCWAHGLRNGYSSFWDLETNRLLIAEVGGNKGCQSKEDIHLGKAGANYGWPYCEGKCGDKNFPQCNCKEHDQPMFTYGRKQYGSSSCKNMAVIGGAVVRNTNWPAEYYGAYFYADFGRNTVSYLTFEEDDVEKVKSDHLFSSKEMKNVISMTTDLDGNLWVTAYKDYRYGVIYKITYDAGNSPPTLMLAAASKTAGAPPLPIIFSSIAKDAEGDAMTYLWQYGDGSSGTGAQAVHTYTKSGTYNAQVMVSDGTATALSKTIEIVVGAPPLVEIVQPIDQRIFKAGDTIEMLGSAKSYDEEIGEYVPMDDKSMVWSIGFIHDDHVHPLGENPRGASTSFIVPNTGHSFAGGTGLRFILTATDANRLEVSTTVEMWPDQVIQPFETVPSGMAVVVDDHEYTTPFTIETIVGFQHHVKVNSCVGGVQHKLVGNNAGLTDMSGEVLVTASEGPFTAQFASSGVPCRTSVYQVAYELVGKGWCRNSNGETQLGDDQISWFAKTADACEEQCTNKGSSCTGYEFSTRNKRCFLHSMEIVDVAHKTVRVCQRKLIVEVTTSDQPASPSKILIPAPSSAPTTSVSTSAPTWVPTTTPTMAPSLAPTMGPSLAPTTPKMSASSKSLSNCAKLEPAGFKFVNGHSAVCAASAVNSKCYKAATYLQAEAVCSLVGARLCSAEELKDDVTRGTGCSMDMKRVWTKDSCKGGMMTALGRRAGSHKSPPRCEKNLKEQQAVRCCGDAALSPETPAIPQAENQPSVVQVIEPKSCEKLENVLGFYHGNTDRCGASQMDGKCHKAATFKEATATCSAVGARLCSAEELVKDVARSSGCNLDTSMVWTSTPGNCGPNSWMVSRGSSLGFIASRHLKCFESDLLTRKRGVRCCAEVAAPSFRARRSVPASVSVPLDDTAQQLGSVLPFVAGVAVLAMAAVLAVQQFASRTATVRTIEIPNNSHYQHTLVTVTAI